MTCTRRKLSPLVVYGGIALISAGFSCLGGCQQNLFSDSDAITKSRINRYYNRDSAIESTESRKRGSDFGFGMPTGGGSSY